MKEDILGTRLSEIIVYIKSNRLSEAGQMISRLLPENDHSSKIHNLLGVIAEFSGKIDLAITHYRVSYVIDPSYCPANRNLERITAFNYRRKFKDIDYGEMN